MASLRPRWGYVLNLVCLLLVVAGQVFGNYHTWLINGADHLYYLRGLNHHPLPYIDARIEYPVLTGMFMTVPAALTHGIQGYLRLNSLLLGGCAVGCAWTLWSISRRAGWVFALCPLLLVFSLINWDLFAILLMLLGWRAYLQHCYAAAGGWLALGVFAKLFPVFLLGACLVALLKRWRTRRDRAARDGLVAFVTAAVAASAVVNLPFAVPAFHNWLWFWIFNAQRTYHSDLLSWLHLGGFNTASIGTTNLVLSALVLAGVAVGAVAIWRGARVADVAAVVFVWFMVMEKVYSPQYTLWIVVYALLADWELWTIVALTAIGLIDYASAAVHIELVHSVPPAPKTLSWYEDHIMYAQQGLRLLGSIAIGGAMLTRDARSRPCSDRTAGTATRPQDACTASEPRRPAEVV